MKKAVFINSRLVLPVALTLLGSCLQADALQIVYPKSTNAQINAKSTFFVGNTAPDSILKINGKDIKVYENGAFVEVVELNEGINKIKIESVTKTAEETVTETINYTITKPAKAQGQAKKPELVEFSENEYVYAASIKDNVPLRLAPNNNAKRVTHISKDTVLMLNGKEGDFYRVSITPEKNLWVQEKNVVKYSTINTKMLSNISNVTVNDDKLYTYIKTDFSFPVPYEITETDTGLHVDFFNIKEHPADTKMFKPNETIKSFAINNVTSDNQCTYFIELNDRLWGYDAAYEENKLVLKIRKKPQIDANNPLKNITIVIDPGHGGKESGAVGPTCVKEKDINLDISLKLKKVLEAAGATVFLTRESDVDIDLYERVDSAKKSNSLILLSLHANALPDGLNPYEKHGTSVFYYNKEAQKLADTIKASMLEKLNLRDDGTKYGNFVLTRTSMPLSVLIETAYMINPEEYNLLLNNEFKQSVAESIKTGLETYLLQSVNDK